MCVLVLSPWHFESLMLYGYSYAIVTGLMCLSESGMSIEVHNISKRFGNFVALDDVSLRIGGGELIALLGPSGSGKTTLLRIIAGLEIPDSGTVHLEGEEATGRSVRERGVGFVFQHYALFRHMTVFENVAFGLRVRPRSHRPPEAEIGDRVNQLLKLVQLEWAGSRLPSQLSGGTAPADRVGASACG